MNPQVKDLTSYNTRKKESLKPEEYSLSNTDFRHLKVLDLLNKNGFRTLETLRDDLGLWNLNKMLSQIKPATRGIVSSPKPHINMFDMGKITHHAIGLTWRITMVLMYHHMAHHTRCGLLHQNSNI